MKAPGTGAPPESNTLPAITASPIGGRVVVVGFPPSTAASWTWLKSVGAVVVVVVSGLGGGRAFPSFSRKQAARAGRSSTTAAASADRPLMPAPGEPRPGRPPRLHPSAGGRR